MTRGNQNSFSNSFLFWDYKKLVMKLIKLTQGKFAQVDDSDLRWLNQWKWYANKVRKTWYAQRDVVINGKHKRIFMHRLIMDTPKNMEVDHCDLDGLNCQRHNMRNCTKSQNCMNRRGHGKSKFKGVYLWKNSIRASIKVSKKTIYLGSYLTEECAALAYDKAAKIYNGEFAYLNFK